MSFSTSHEAMILRRDALIKLSVCPTSASESSLRIIQNPTETLAQKLGIVYRRVHVFLVNLQQCLPSDLATVPSQGSCGDMLFENRIFPGGYSYSSDGKSRWNMNHSRFESYEQRNKSPARMGKRGERSYQGCKTDVSRPPPNEVDSPSSSLGGGYFDSRPHTQTWLLAPSKFLPPPLWKGVELLIGLTINAHNMYSCAYHDECSTACSQRWV